MLTRLVNKLGKSIIDKKVYQNRFKEGVKYFEDMAFTLKFYTKRNDNDLVVFLSSSIYYIRKREAENSTMNQSHKARGFYIDALELCLETLKESKNKSEGLFLHTQYAVFSNLQAGHASGGPFFSVLPEKTGEKRDACYGTPNL